MSKNKKSPNDKIIKEEKVDFDPKKYHKSSDEHHINNYLSEIKEEKSDLGQKKSDENNISLSNNNPIKMNQKLKDFLNEHRDDNGILYTHVSQVDITGKFRFERDSIETLMNLYSDLLYYGD